MGLTSFSFSNWGQPSVDGNYGNKLCDTSPGGGGGGGVRGEGDGWMGGDGVGVGIVPALSHPWSHPHSWRRETRGEEMLGACSVP